MSNNKVIRNAGMLYVRMLVMLFVSLYTSRVVLNTLGVSDFGIYNVVGGIVIHQQYDGWCFAAFFFL